MSVSRKLIGVSGIAVLALLAVSLMLSFPSLNRGSLAQELFGADDMQIGRASCRERV